MRLLRLGAESVPALLEYVRSELAAGEYRSSSAEEVRSQRDSSYSRQRVTGLDLLADLGDPRAVPELLSLAERLQHPLSQDRLAEALVRYGDLRAAPVLFRYARAEGSDPQLRRAALHFACRAGDIPGLEQRHVTRYLLACLAAPGSPPWLRRFAQFELLNERGAPARAAALATFHWEPRARLLPDSRENVGQGGSRSEGEGVSERWSFTGEPAVRDERGAWWTVAPSALLDPGSLHLWVARSADRKGWFQPAFAASLSPTFASLESTRLRSAGGRLLVELRGTAWQQGKERPVHRRLELPLGELYRDGDGDGLPDRLERQIGSDPGGADTDANGIPDGEDKNPGYRPHPLSDEEGIYQAAVEALCQLGRSAPAGGQPGEPYDAVPAFLGRSREPLVLPLPRGSRGIRVLSHPGVVLLYSEGPVATLLRSGTSMGSSEFTRPNVRLDGTAEEQPIRRHWERWAADPFDPAATVSLPGDPSFRDFFPYALSADRR
ncbi:MAG TPA: hypothetical protein VK689_02955, partial [Armatimonadota bacterium]|nr:hypothetical protein [Armatimonadota bacterium]